jgi:surface protein
MEDKNKIKHPAEKEVCETGHAEAYAVLNDDNTMLTFYYDHLKEARHGMDIGPFSYDHEHWNGFSDQITTVVFDESFATCKTITSTACWFAGCKALTAFIGIEKLKTDHVTDMSGMFFGCSRLENLDLSGFNTGKVTDMSYMFFECSRLENLDLSGFNTGNVTDMSYMFNGCSSLENLDLSGFNIRNVTFMMWMFSRCPIKYKPTETGFIETE